MPIVEGRGELLGVAGLGEIGKVEEMGRKDG
jgi:hypothetical protein